MMMEQISRVYDKYDRTAPISLQKQTRHPDNDDDGKYDFGIAEAYEQTTNLTVTLKNKSSENLYFDSVDFGDADEHFAILSNKCPISPSLLIPEYECEIIISFAPQAPETIITLMAAVYGEEPGETNLRTEVFAQGRGVSPIDFEGIKDVDRPTTTTIEVSWSANSEVVNYTVMMALGEEPSDNDFFLKESVPNEGGAVSFATVDGLVPDTYYSFKVNAVDLLGNNLITEKFITGRTLPNNAPDIDQGDWLTSLPAGYYSSSAAPNFNIRDAITLADEDIDGDPISYTCTFTVTNSIATDKPCSELQNQDGTFAVFNKNKGEFSGWSPKDTWVGESIKFTIVASDPYNITDSITSGSIAISPGVPNAPLFKYLCDKDTNLDVATAMASCSLTDPSPSPVQQIEVVGKHTRDGTNAGVAVPGDEIFIYSNNSCSNLLGSGVTNSAGWFAINITLPANQTTDLTAKSRNGVGNESACSAVFASYTHDNIAPSPLTFSGIYPFGPSWKTDPEATLKTEALASVGLYTDPLCANLIPGSNGFANASGDFTATLDLSSYPASVTEGARVDMYIGASDASGNSACSPLVHSYYIYNKYSAFYQSTATVSNGTTTNPNTADSLVLNAQRENGFSLSASDEITVPHAGDYSIMLNLPVEGTDDRSRTRLYAEVLDSGDSVIYRTEFSQSSYIRGLDGHYESSNTLNTVLPGLSAGDKVKIMVEHAGEGSARQFFDTAVPASIFIEYIDPYKPAYTAKITGPASIQYKPISAYLKLAEHIKTTIADDLGFSVSTGVIDRVTLPVAGQYLVSVNVPFKVTTADIRCAPEIRVLLDSDPVGRARQSYIRNASNDDFSSSNWIGIVETENPNSKISLEMAGASNNCTSAGEIAFDVTTRAGASSSINASLNIELLDSSYGLIYAKTDTVTDGVSDTNLWNQDIDDNFFANFSSTEVVDLNTFTLNAANEEITIAETGLYIMTYTGAYQTINQRGNVKIEAILSDGGTSTIGTTQAAYIRNGDGHTYSSNAMSSAFITLSPNATMKFRSSVGRITDGGTDFNSVLSAGSGKFVILKKD